MSEPGEVVIDVRTRRKNYRCQKQKQESELGGGVIIVRTRRRVTVVKFRRRIYKCQNQEEEL